MKVTILCVGKFKERYWELAAGEYEKRLRRYCSLTTVQIPDLPTPEGASAREEDQIKSKEGDRILSWLDKNASGPGDRVIALAIGGIRMDSLTFASRIGQAQSGGVSQIVFVIGGSLGLSDAVLGRADRNLSFSDFTFPHQLMRVILLEQVYRAYRILNRQPYHK